MSNPFVMKVLWKIALVVPGLMLFACQGSSIPAETAAVSPGQQGDGYPRPELLVDPEWLEANLDSDSIVVLDVRPSPSYDVAHIPGAARLSPVDLQINEPVRGMVGPLRQVERAMERVGVADNSRVVIYDDDRGMWAARVFWILEYYGKTGVSLLNGGFARWQSEGRPVTDESPEITESALTLSPNPARIATKGEVKAALEESGTVLVDARTPREYTGAVALSDRGGRIPRAISVPWEDTLTADEVQIFRPKSELAALYRKAGVSSDGPIIVYCQTGVRASHGYFTLRLMGYDDVRVYDGSWEEWGNDPGLPLDRG